MKEQKVYVLGFVYEESLKGREEDQHVLLLEKYNPEWQRGKLNGIGGKVEENETINEAMRRESLEEVNLDINISDWKGRGLMRGDGWIVHIFSAYADLLSEKSHLKQMEKECPIVVKVRDIHKYNILSNLHFLVPLLCHKAKLDMPFVLLYSSYQD